jgi:aminoglycoside phosphotransferase family enzyme/predicted kinase
MDGSPAITSTVDRAWTPENMSAEVRETHTGIVFLIGDKAYKAKKPVRTDFLDFSTVERRERACAHEVIVNSRLAPDSYLGVAHFSFPSGGPDEPVIVMHRYPDAFRLAWLVEHGQPVDHQLRAIAETLARFHQEAPRDRAIDAQGGVCAISERWQQNLAELHRYADGVIAQETIREIDRLATQFISGRTALFAQRITDRRAVDGHGDLLADDIFCLPDGPPILLDCLDFDDRLRYLDSIDDAAFLAMVLEFLGRKDLGDSFLDEYARRADDNAPRALKDFYIAYRALVRAKVDCVRIAQGHPEAVAAARRHLDIALGHLRTGTVRLVIVGGGPGTGKTTLARGLGEQIGAQVISTDDVRRELRQSGAIGGAPDIVDAGLYAPDNVSAVYDEVLRRAHMCLCGGVSVILDGTWRDVGQRERARRLAKKCSAPIVEFTCTLALEQAAVRIQNRAATTSDATPAIAAALAEQDSGCQDGHAIDTSRPLSDSVAEAHQICCLAF